MIFSMQLTRKIRIQGKVQGVGFREAMVREALRLGLVGWVRNCADGSVEALVQGEPAAMEDILQWVRLGPPNSEVEDLSSESSQPDPSLSGFTRRENA
jgi:acylphosphatase